MEKNIKIGDAIYSVASDDNYLDAVGGVFEPHMVQLFRALIGPDDVVADIGANIGLTAILFSSLARKVFAFEPSPSTYNILAGNLDRAGVTNVEAINLGLGHKTESLTITFAKNNRSGGYVSDKIRPEIGHVTEDIRIDTLDHYFADSDVAPSFLKIDVEGFEQNVIKGAGLFLQKNKPVVVMEMNHFCLDVLQRITIPDFLDFMRSVFTYLYAVDSDNATIVNLHDPDRAYFVMHEHVVQHRFPNLVGGFVESVNVKLSALAATAEELAQRKHFKTPTVANPAGGIQAISIPESVVADGMFEIPVIIQNTGTETWHGYGTHPVFLCYHWRDSQGQYAVYDGIRTELKNKIVRPGESIRETVNILAPSAKGRLNLNLTIVQEGICWFEDRGFACANAVVVIN